MSFERQLAEWQRKTEIKIGATHKEALQDLVDAVDKPRAKGGQMPVDTGFLRNSGQGSIGQPGSAESSPGNEGATALAINRIQPGQMFYYVFTANYAPFMEAKYGFVRLAKQRWPEIVDAAVKRVG